MNKNSPLKSGWFYLWLVLTLLFIWGDLSDSFAKIESLNLRLIDWAQPDTKTESRVVRVQLSQSEGKDVNTYQSIIEDFPKANFVILANLNATSIKMLNQLDIDKDKLVVFSEQAMTSSQLKKSALNQKIFISSHQNILWKTLANLELAVQPDSNRNALQLIFQKGSSLYPTLVTASVLSFHRDAKNFQMTQSKVIFTNQKSGFSELKFGLNGSIYPLGDTESSLVLSELSGVLSNNFDGMLLIDDLTNPSSDKIFQSLLSLQNKNYLVVSITSYLSYLVLWLLLSWIVFALTKYTLTQQNLLIGLLALGAIAIQMFLVKFSLWLPIYTLVLLCLFAVLINFGVYNDQLPKSMVDKKLNQLLSETALELLRNQKAQLLIEQLEVVKPDSHLIDIIKEVATEAEAYKNMAIASQLYHWILTHRKNESFCLQRLTEINKLNEPEQLDQTIVIDGKGKTQLATSSNLLSIKNFGRYEVEGILGKGAMGVVFQGVDPKINRHVAIKTLQLNEDLDDESFTEKKQRFFREAETAGNLSHANIVTIYDVGEQKHENSNQSLGYIAMDLLTGAPLSEFVKKDKLLPPPLVYQLMIQMTDALDYAHRQKVIHRDIKPGNIIFDDDLRRGTLTDFGIAYMSDHSKTKTGTIMGSPYYMSPEQVMGQTVDGRSDIFSLGVTFYQLLTGHLPFNGESIATVAFHITKTKHEPVRNLNKKLLTSSTRITNKAMHKDPEKRYQTMQEFKQALVNALKRDYKKSPL